MPSNQQSTLAQSLPLMTSWRLPNEKTTAANVEAQEGKKQQDLTSSPKGGQELELASPRQRGQGKSASTLPEIEAQQTQNQQVSQGSGRKQQQRMEDL